MLSCVNGKKRRRKIQSNDSNKPHWDNVAPVLHCFSVIPSQIQYQTDMTRMLEDLSLLLVNYIFAWQVKHSSHHIKGWDCRRTFLATMATGRDPNNNNKVKRYHKCLHMIFFSMSNVSDTSLWVPLGMTDNNLVSRFEFHTGSGWHETERNAWAGMWLSNISPSRLYWLTYCFVHNCSVKSVFTLRNIISPRKMSVPNRTWLHQSPQILILWETLLTPGCYVRLPVYKLSITAYSR